MSTTLTDVVFGPFVFEPSELRLVRDHAEIRFAAAARRVLRVLLLHRGHTVGYEHQMMAEAWQGTFVSRHTWIVTVAEVRKSLSEFGGGSRIAPKRAIRSTCHRPRSSSAAGALLEPSDT
jgi:DNA-binding winged helix-turn-helix (wHTH) protein